MKIDIQETINQLHELDQKASPAPWRTVFSTNIYSGGEEVFEVGTSYDDICEWVECSDECGCAGYARKPDIDLLVATRNAIPVLLAEIERLTAQNKNLEEAWEDGYADAICDVEGVYMFDRAELTTTPNPYKENKK